MTQPLRPESHAKGSVAVATVLLFFAQLNWVAYAIPGDSDYGEDIEVTAFVGGVRTHLYFRCQVKAAGQDSTYVKRLKSGGYSVKVRASTLQAWVACHYPVVVIVYDEADKTLRWADAVEQVHGRTSLLTQKTLNVVVSRLQILNEVEILNFVQGYYAALIRVDDPVLSSDLIVTLMPACKGISAKDLNDLLCSAYDVRGGDAGLQLWSQRQDADFMPTWATAMFSGTFMGVIVLKASAGGKQLNEFMTLVRDVLRQHLPQTPDGAWFSCAWSPIKLRSKSRSSREASVWTKDLTDWFSESLLCGGWIDDKIYSFASPPGFQPQVAAKATGWSTLHFIDSDSDVALRMLSSVFTHAADLVGAQSRVREIERLFFPWQCPRSSEGALLSGLMRLSSGLIFPLEFVSFPNLSSEELLVGYVSSAMFSPSAGVFGPGDDWAFPEMLEKIARDGSLPGEYGPETVRVAVMECFPGSEVPPHWLVSQKEYNSPLPLHHGRRSLQVFRLFLTVDESRRDLAEERMALAKIALSEAFSDYSELDVGVVDIDGEISMCYVQWRPDLNRASDADFRVRRPFVISFLDAVLPSAQSNRTRELLGWVGVYFE